MKAIRSVLSALAAVALVSLVAARARAECGCSANPGTLTSDGTGPCLRYAAPSGASNDIIYRFAEAYACGAYATGEFFVVAKSNVAQITAISPAASGGRHGVDVNPSPDGPQRWDDRLADHAAPVALPYAAAPGSSVVKYVSDNPSGDCDGSADEKSCGRFAAVVTVVDVAPADPSHAFRPPFVGKNKPSFSSAALQTQLLSRLNGDACDAPTQATALAWTQHLRLDYTSHSVTCDLMPPEDALPDGRPWSTDIWAHDTDVYAWLELSNVCAAPPCTAEQDLQTKLPVLVGYVQHGIDIWGVDKLGSSLFRGGGGNGGGKLFAYVFAATMLSEPQLRADLAAVHGDRFFETASYYAGKNGVALWGQPSGSDQEYWADFSDRSTRTIRDPYGFIDGGFEPGGWYQDNTAKPTKYSALLLRLMPALQTVWPINKDVILQYADRWVAHGALTLPDPCAPVSGKYGTDYGPNGSGSCIAGSGRVPSLDGDNKDGGNRERTVGECMWRTFRDCSETCTCKGQVCGAGAGGNTGSGGASASGGSAGNGGTANSAGSSATSGGSGVSGGASVGGSSGSSAGGSNSSVGGSGADSASPEAGSDGAGCGCNVVGTRPSLLPVLLALCAVLVRRVVRRQLISARRRP